VSQQQWLGSAATSVEVAAAAAAAAGNSSAQLAAVHAISEVLAARVATGNDAEIDALAAARVGKLVGDDVLEYLDVDAVVVIGACYWCS
jgi:hypothetical protein